MKKNDSRSGQALLMMTFSLVAMFGMMALTVDLGWGYFRREGAQTAADAAAAAVIQAAVNGSPGSQACGTNNVWCGSPVGTATACASTPPTTPVTTYDYGCKLAASNGFLNTGSQTVTIQANTTSNAPTVPGTAVSYWAVVRISENANSFFRGIGGFGLLSTSAVATAGLTNTAGSISSTCMYILSPHGADAFNLGNNAVVNLSSCGLYVNSDNTTTEAMFVTGSAHLTAASVNSVGKVKVNNNGCINKPNNNTCNSLTPTTGGSAIADPFLNLPSPTPAGSCQSGNFTNWQPTAYTPSAGTYCGMSIGNGMAAILGAGTYIINGGTFSIQGGSTVTTTGGVMIYLTNGATVNIGNGANVTMSAETSGPYQGVLFYQDRTMTSPGASSFVGGTTTNLTGSLYFPNALLNINNGSSSNTEAIVAGSVSFQGGSATTFKQATAATQTGLGTAGSSNAMVIQ